MEFLKTLGEFSNYVLTAFAIFIFIAALIITLLTRFIQFRAIKKMFSILFGSITNNTKESAQTIQPHKALFTAMSTIIGMAVIVAPVVAIQMGGPGALLYFLLTNILGSAVNYVEVTFAVKFRKKLPDGTIMGGPMQYIKEVLPESFASIYAILAFILLLFWSALQANTMSDLLINFHIPHLMSGLLLSALVIMTLLGGIKRVGNISEKLVPFMFCLYSVSGMYIIFKNLHQLPAAFDLIFRSAMTPQAILGGSAFGGLVFAIRTGLLKGLNSNEAGLGMAAIPHSMAETDDPSMQGILAILGLYSHGFLCLISGLIVILTGTWQDPTIRFGISAMTKSFQMYFSIMGPLLLTISAMLFIFSTVLGNSYFGEECLKYLANKKHKKIFYFLVGVTIVLGSIAPVKSMWLIPDFLIVLVALPNIIGILMLSFKHRDILKLK